MTAEDLAKAICKADGKNPEKIYKKKPLYEYSLSYASDILANLTAQKIVKPKAAKPAADFDQKLRLGVQAYLAQFNQETVGMGLGRYIPIDQMRPDQLSIHINSLRAAITEMLKE